MIITVDGVDYRVRLAFNTYKRTFTVAEGTNSFTALSGRHIRDVIGTRYAYQMGIEPDARYRQDYDALYEVLSAPVPYHTITVPYGQSTMSFDAEIVSGTDTYKGVIADKALWTGLTVQFVPISPQRSAVS